MMDQVDQLTIYLLRINEQLKSRDREIHIDGLAQDCTNPGALAM